MEEGERVSTFLQLSFDLPMSRGDWWSLLKFWRAPNGELEMESL